MAHDRHAAAVGDAGSNHPRGGVDDVVLHGSAPLLEARQPEAPSEASRSAEVHPQERITAVGEELSDLVVTPRVPEVRAAVDPDHERKPPGGNPQRERQVTSKTHAIPSRERDGPHASEREAGELRVLAEEECAPAGRPIPQVTARRGAVAAEPDQPPSVATIPAADADLTATDTAEGAEICRDRRIQRLPSTRIAQERHRLHGARLRMQQDLLQVEVVGGGDDTLAAVRQRPDDQPGLVGSEIGAQQEGPAVPAEGLDCQAVAGVGRHPRPPWLCRTVSDEHFGAAVSPVALNRPHLEGTIGGHHRRRTGHPPRPLGSSCRGEAFPSLR